MVKVLVCGTKDMGSIPVVYLEKEVSDRAVNVAVLKTDVFLLKSWVQIPSYPC